MGTIGRDAYDKAMAESFFSTLQRVLLDEHRWATRRQLAVFEWIEAWYHPRRRHSSIGRISPVDYEAAHASRRVSTITARNHALRCPQRPRSPRVAWTHPTIPAFAERRPI